MPRYLEKVPEVEAQHGSLDETIPRLLDEFNGNQRRVAEILGLSPAFISRWLRQHGYVQKIRWVKVGDRQTA